MALPEHLLTLPLDEPVWERFFSVFPLVLVGTREEDGGHDLAPKHLAMPLSWRRWFGFVCTPRHRTYQNAVRSGAFTVSYPRPEQVVVTRGRLMGLNLEQATAGGGSDGNTTGLYTATLDGLGPVGDGAHAHHEFVVVDQLIERTALLALLLLEPPLSGGAPHDDARSSITDRPSAQVPGSGLK